MAQDLRFSVDVPLTFSHRRWRLGAWIGVPLYAVWTHFTIGIATQHILICLALLALFSFHRKAAYFGALILPFFIGGMLYDNLRLVIHLRGPIHVSDLYEAELALFGVETSHGRMILPFVFRDINWPFMDFVSGITYALYLLQTFLLGAYLVIKDRSRLPLITWGWLFLNFAGWITWLVWPAAPPWYVDTYGLGPAIADALPQAAGAARFDNVIGQPFFNNFYSHSSNVFGAMPSLHCAYPTLCVWVGWSMGRFFRYSTILFAALMCFSAVYLQHHYVLDVIAGIAFATAIFHLVRAWLAGHDDLAQPASPPRVTAT